MRDFSNTSFGLRVTWAYHCLPRADGVPPTQVSVQLRAGLKSPGELNKIMKEERSQKRMQAERVQNLARALQVSPRWLEFGVGTAPEPTGYLKPREVKNRKAPPKGWSVWLPPDEWYEYETKTPIQPDEEVDILSEVLEEVLAEPASQSVKEELEELAYTVADGMKSQRYQLSRASWFELLRRQRSVMLRLAQRPKSSRPPPSGQPEGRGPYVPKPSGTVELVRQRQTDRPKSKKTS